MDLNNLATTAGDDGYYSEGFRNTIASMIPTLRSKYTSSNIIPDNFGLHKYVGDLFGFLDYSHIAKRYHFAIMLFNDMKSPSDFTESTLIINVPNLNEIDLMYQVYTTATFAIG